MDHQETTAAIISKQMALRRSLLPGGVSLIIVIDAATAEIEL